MNLKKAFVSGCTIFAIGYGISKLIKFAEESEKRTNRDSHTKYYSASFESNEYKPGRTFKGGDIHTVCSSVTFDINNLLVTEPISININAVMSAVNIIIPKGYKAVISNISRLGAVEDASDMADYEAGEEKVINIYVSGFMSAVFVHNN